MDEHIRTVAEEARLPSAEYVAIRYYTWEANDAGAINLLSFTVDRPERLIVRVQGREV